MTASPWQASTAKRMRNVASPQTGNLPESMAHDIQKTGKFSL